MLKNVKDDLVDVILTSTGGAIIDLGLIFSCFNFHIFQINLTRKMYCFGYDFTRAVDDMMVMKSLPNTC